MYIISPPRAPAWSSGAARILPAPVVEARALQPGLMVSIQHVTIEVIVKLRQMVEQCIQRFVSEMIHWPNREQNNSNQAAKVVSGLYGAVTEIEFCAAILKSKMKPPMLEIGKMDLETHFPAVLTALHKAQPFYQKNSSGDLPNPWWRTIIIISNICKHARQLEIQYIMTRSAIAMSCGLLCH